MVMIALFVMFVGGVVASLIAGAKQRNAAVWFLIGAIFPLGGIIAAIVAGPGTRALELEAGLGLPILPESRVVHANVDPNTAVCAFCQQRVPATRTTFTADGVFCDACAANR